MHAAFIPYGKVEEVDLMLNDMRAQKHQLKLWKGKKNASCHDILIKGKDGYKEKTIWIQSQIRYLPFGVIEYVFPKEDMDLVLTTLMFKDNKRYGTSKLIYSFIRKMIKCKKIPEFKTDKHYLWITTHVNIIPVGIREDGEFTDPDGPYKGWTHEAI